MSPARHRAEQEHQVLASGRRVRMRDPSRRLYHACADCPSWRLPGPCGEGSAWDFRPGSWRVSARERGRVRGEPRERLGFESQASTTLKPEPQCLSQPQFPLLFGSSRSPCWVRQSHSVSVRKGRRGRGSDWLPPSAVASPQIRVAGREGRSPCRPRRRPARLASLFLDLWVLPEFSSFLAFPFPAPNF